VRVAHHRPFAVIDLHFLAGRRFDDGSQLRRGTRLQSADETRTLWYPAAKLPVSTRSGQIAFALRPSESPSSIA